MNDTKPSVFVVDDAEDQRMLVTAILGMDFNVIALHSGEDCLAQLEHTLPEVVLLDIHMAGMNGFEVCKKIRSKYSAEVMVVIFISGSESIVERLMTYEVGGDDYLAKPFHVEELVKKVHHRLSYLLRFRALQQRTTLAMSTAMEAMTSSAELGLLLSFIRSSMALNDVNGLASELTKSLEEFGLSACFLINRSGGYVLYGCDGESMEGKVLLGVGHEKSIYEFGRRVIFLRKNVRLLIENMPFGQEEKYGRLKDNLLILCDCVNARAESLRILQLMQQERDKLMEQVLKRSEVQLNSVRLKLDHHADATHRIMRKMVDELDERLLFLGLDEDQEKSLRRLADQTHENIESLNEINVEIYASVDNVMQDLYHLVQKDT